MLHFQTLSLKRFINKRKDLDIKHLSTPQELLVKIDQNLGQNHWDIRHAG